jgi:protein-S-isoprenylcysteine O-methyltransferase Ste14
MNKYLIVILLHQFIFQGMFLIKNIIISVISLIDMKDSWRVGILEDQKTALISPGIYRYTRNPYFVSYILMFTAYTVLLQNIVLLGLSFIGIVFIHKMILKEEAYLHKVHGEVYIQYKKKVSRYILI